MTKRKPAAHAPRPREVTSAGTVNPITDDTGQTHYPHREGGPSFATVCYADGWTWPCPYAASKGAEAVTDEPGTFDPSTPGPTIEGTNAHTITTSGKLTREELIEAGLPIDAATAIAAAQDATDRA